MVNPSDPPTVSVNVRLIALPDAMDLVLASLTDRYGPGWQLATEQPRTLSRGQIIRHGTLTIPNPRQGEEDT